MKLFQKYIIFNYLKNFFIIFLSLEFFYVGVDTLSNYNDFPDSANLQLLYIVFKTLDAMNYAIPLSIVFAMIVTKFAMIKSNELVTLYAVGITKKAIVQPLFLSSLALALIYISLNFTSFSYAYEYSRNLLKYSTISTASNELFLKNNNEYIYFKKLDPIKKYGSDIKIFTIKNNDLSQIISAKKGYFNKDNWVLIDVVIKNKPEVGRIDGKGFTQEVYDKYKTLKDFRPKIIENIHKGKYNMSIIDTIDALVFFSSQNLNLDRIKTLLYSHVLFPLFAPFLVVILFYKLPISNRFFNLAFLSFVFIFITLSTWGILFILTKLSSTSVIFPELGVILPIVLLGFFALFSHYKEN
ncbi:LptF/LptG family permease [Sulfurospirillum arcachonense]|uniref:LptF/LptG family permease n=1 Tax=Sulfurospirillum arcachonense TaxID=57666 RepID=UPI00046A2900|nr:LptF/LptG family permease [Sulfurospirillum arcachonense]